MTESFDHVVIGAGALGSAAAYWLKAKGGGTVAVLEQFTLGHSRGASEDHSRIIRHAYHSPVYTALTRAAYESWEEIEELSGTRLVTKTGGLDLATHGTIGIEELESYVGSLESAGIGYERLGPEEIRRRWPQWRIGDDVSGFYQEDTGILDISAATAAHVRLSQALGVSYLEETTVRSVDLGGSAVTVVTDKGELSASTLTVCVASWIHDLMSSLGVSWNVTLSQEQVSYFAPLQPDAFSPDKFPVFLWHGDPLYYGFPVFKAAGVKAARDMTGRFITSAERSYEPDPSETEIVRRFLSERLPQAAGPELLSKTCVYDMAPDRDFVLDRLPSDGRVTVALGAGHAGKFASLIGKILADLALKGETSHPIDAFSAKRPALYASEPSSSFRLRSS